MARLALAVLSSAMLIASPVLASAPVRPAVSTVKLAQPVNLMSARVGAPLKKKSSSDIAQAGVGFALAAVVAVGAGVGIATSDNNNDPVSP